ncbi:Signal transduction histidine kinase [Lentzea xinjiangensis]|uniref:histidine kinase n=1 Tax=Lentzea xinjiangensis TaxID=402600 RepID=A0A1H9WH68_9PSEU|nr:histidine kinase [Lentzea xinjiangensis]SES33099.1 Signal transduction histidine kinase [Lentzea xinjiangensis]
MSLGILAVLGLAGGLGTEDGGLPVWQVCAWVVLAVLAYLHGRHVDARFGWQVLTGVALAGTAAVALLDLTEVPTVLVVMVITVVLPWLAGRYRRQQALLIAAEQERVRQLEREQEHVAERARLQERGRLAAELHDSLGHDLALIALRAGALELSPKLSDEDTRTAGAVRASAVAATDRLRQSIAMLRERDDVPPVAVLVANARDAGMSVTVDGLADLPDVVDQAVRRVAREALTNAARHAPGQPVTMTLTVAERLVTLEVGNPLTGRVGRGSGLAALAERLRLLGGELAVTAEHGLFTLVARVPLT